MPSLPTIQHEIKQVESVLDLMDETACLDAKNYIGELEESRKDKIDAIAHVLGRYESDAEYLDRRADELKAQAKAIRSKKERFRQFLFEFMKLNGLQKLPGRESTLSIRKNQGSVQISVPIPDLPEEYRETRIDIVPRKDALKAAIKAGIEIKGVSIVAGETLAIR